MGMAAIQAEHAAQEFMKRRRVIVPEEGISKAFFIVGFFTGCNERYSKL